MGKTVGMVAQGACRSLIIFRCELGDQGVYVCDAHDAQSSASLKVQGRQIKGQGLLGQSLLATLHPPSKVLSPLAPPRPEPLSNLGGRGKGELWASTSGTAFLPPQVVTSRS